MGPARAGALSANPDGGWRGRVTSRLGRQTPKRALRRTLADAETAVASVRQSLAEAGGAFTMNEVATQTQMSLATLYRYFPSKDELLLAVLEDSITTGAAYLSSYIEAQPTAVARLRAAVVGPLVFAFTEGELPKELQALVGERERLQGLFPEALRAAIKTFERVIQGELERAADAGVIRPTDTERDAHAIYSLVGSHVPSLAAAPPTPAELEAVVEHLWQFCARALGVDTKL